MFWRIITSALLVHLSRCRAAAVEAGDCPGNQVRQACASACPFTCDDVPPLSTAACVEVCLIDACECPSHLPVWHNGECIAESDCPSYDPCQAVECEAGYTCKLHEVTCVRSPCPIVPVCENLAETLCASTSCPENTVCKLDEVECETESCDQFATSCVDQNICSLPSGSGPCEALVPSWYYDSYANMCKQFDYGGCEGNENRFVFKSACERACKPYDPCEETECEQGYACESRDVDCVQDPCLPVAECVDLAKDCDDLSCPSGQTCKLVEVQCVTTPCHPQPTCVDEAICDQPIAVTGRCDGQMKRWSYNQYVNNCEDFVYSGCDGNENNFVSKSACQRSCQKLDEPFCLVGKPLREDFSPTADCCGGDCPNQITCPSTHECHIHPEGAFAVCCPRQNLTDCQWSKMENDQPGLMDAPSIHCDGEGNYAKRHCDGFMGLCTCVTREKGEWLPDSTTSYGEDHADCDSEKFKPYYGAKYCRLEQENTMNLEGAYSPLCDKFGLYERKQCHTLGPTFEECWCVTLEGKEIPTSRSSHNAELDCEDVRFERFYSSGSSCLEEAAKMRDYADAHIPECDDEGFYKQEQCYYMDYSGWTCWCVTKDGREIPESREWAGREAGLNNITLDCDATQLASYYNMPGKNDLMCFSCDGTSDNDSASCFEPNNTITPTRLCSTSCLLTHTMDQSGFTTVTRGCGDVSSCINQADRPPSCCTAKHQCNEGLILDAWSGAATRPRAVLALLLETVLFIVVALTI